MECPDSTSAGGAESSQITPPSSNPHPTRLRTINGMQIFERTLSDKTHKRFHDVLERLAEPLAAYLRKSRKEYRPTSIRLMSLGYDENSVSPWIVVLCPDKVQKRAEKFFQQELARRLCQPDEPGQERFRVTVLGHPPRPKCAEQPDQVRIACARLKEDEKRLWSPQIKTDHCGVTRYATMGGYIVVSESDGTLSIYGLTAGHLIAEADHSWRGAGAGSWDGSESSADDSESEQERSSPEKTSIREVRQHEEDPTWMDIGRLSDYSFSRQARDRDWGLIEGIEAYGFSDDNAHDVNEKIELGTAGKERELLIGFNHEASHKCLLSKSPTMVILPHGHRFVWAHTLTLQSVVSPPGSPSSDRTITVYGQIVADDVFGHVYMIPLRDILHDITQTMQVAAARLPVSISEKKAFVGSNVDLSSSIDYQPEAQSVATTDHFDFHTESSQEAIPQASKGNLREGIEEDLSESEPKAKSPRTNTPWTPAEEERLRRMRDNGDSWSKILKTYPNRTGESRVTRSSTRSDPSLAESAPSKSSQAGPKAEKTGRSSVATKHEKNKGAKSSALKSKVKVATAQDSVKSEGTSSNVTVLTITSDAVKNPIQCHNYASPNSNDPSPQTLIFTHGAGGTLYAPAVVNFCAGFSTAVPILAFQGSMNLASRVKGFHACLEHLERSQGELVLGGRSMGARAAVMAATEYLKKEKAGSGSTSVQLILVSYPLKGPKDDIRDEILLSLTANVEVLFVIGDRDAMCPLDLLESVRGRMKVESKLIIVKGADHGMHVKPAKREKEFGEETGRLAAEWVAGKMHEGVVYVGEEDN
ncbi:uncharacterized protein K460DRAFT_328285 [Cucurbitaria berberidis CBS 394.84]|uniref:KANL3/Tex30 alpha/beta hydrolase-like domain-containing protein n=1 Tax=Cucurbitaria berberidis CBS 394.84 TaxID=1168544 RepID=A0A9P4GTC0_9PLEO|nr:uncharacterized protein K460DRAFT_328285 [Cucurbitaria berberidis CBS 394.84]KAF1850914.1 hypothetical protein K460DRAFT_328285 [Cucurbitaria berberidis CBS 394.84]